MTCILRPTYMPSLYFPAPLHPSIQVGFLTGIPSGAIKKLKISMTTWWSPTLFYMEQGFNCTVTVAATFNLFNWLWMPLFPDLVAKRDTQKLYHKSKQPSHHFRTKHYISPKKPQPNSNNVILFGWCGFHSFVLLLIPGPFPPPPKAGFPKLTPVKKMGLTVCSNYDTMTMRFY